VIAGPGGESHRGLRASGERWPACGVTVVGAVRPHIAPRIPGRADPAERAASDRRKRLSSSPALSSFAGAYGAPPEIGSRPRSRSACLRLAKSRC
jgi:hypothetical protein